jgi:hypothetical protein
MDRELFRKDAEQALKRLPPALIDDVAKLAVKFIVVHRQALEAVLPAVVADLMPHISAIGMEKALGYFNMKEVEEDVMSVLATFGIKEPPALHLPLTVPPVGPSET